MNKYCINKTIPEVWINTEATNTAGSENFESAIIAKLGSRQDCIRQPRKGKYILAEDP